MICSDDVLLANYTKSTNSWSFGGVNVNNISTHQEVLENHTEALNAVCSATLVNITNISANSTKINTVESIINEYIAKTDAVLKNHYDALLELCEKHGMVDSNTGDGSNVSPK